MDPRTRGLVSVGVMAVACGGGPAADDAPAPDGTPPVAEPDGGDPADAALEPPPCPRFDDPVAVGVVAADTEEISGLVVSRSHAGVLWTHDDSSGSAELFALSPDGEVLAILELGVEVHDPEDLARGAGPGPGEHLYLADTGNNYLEPRAPLILRVPEPAVDGSGATVVARPDVIALRYEDGDPHDAEAIAIDDASGDLYLFTKRNDADPVTRLYRGAGVTAAADGDEIVLEAVLAEADQPAIDVRVVSADVSADDAWILVGARGEPYLLWPRLGAPIEEALRAPPCRSPFGEGQVETGAFADGGYFMIAEGLASPIWFVARREED